MNRIILFFLVQFLVFPSFAQSNEEIALSKAREAIEIMDEGRIEESIILLEESQKLDPGNYMYPYEIAYAHVLKKDYETAIEILKEIKEYDTLNSQVYQMLGNCYSYLGRPDDAIKEYEEGMKHFPNAGNLHLEKGNVFLHQENYGEAIKNYEKGIEVDPTFPSNYYRLAKLFLYSTDKLSGLIYGEIFMNLERTTQRTLDLSELLYNTYKSSITIGKDKSQVDFCKIFVDVSEFESEEDLKFSLCAVYAKNFILATIDEVAFDLSSLSSIRTKFLENYFKDDFKNHPNVLFEYQKELLDNNLFDAYNHYLFQMGAPEEFDIWLEANGKEYDEFVEWYTRNENIIEVVSDNRFIR